MFEGQEGEGTKKKRGKETERLRGKQRKKERGKGRKNEKEANGQNHSLNDQFSNSRQEAMSQSFIFGTCLV